MKTKVISFQDYKPAYVRPSSLRSEKLLKEKNNKVTKSIRKKYLALKLGKSDEDETRNKFFKPVIDSLTELKGSCIKYMTSPLKHQEEKSKFKKEEEESEEVDKVSNRCIWSRFMRIFRKLSTRSRAIYRGIFY